MRSFLLLLSLMTGCETSSKVIGCPEGWVEFTWKYSKPQGTYVYDNIVVDTPRGKKVRKTEGNISLYHDRGNKNVKVTIKQLQREDFGQYNFTLYQENQSPLDTKELELVNERDGCQGQFLQTAYRSAKTTITCDHPGKKSEYDIMFFCKENKKSICEDILSAPSPKSNNSSSFSMSISDVSSHAGVYWCGVKSNDESHRSALRKIQLEVKDITKFTRSQTVGQTFTYWCKYPNGASIKFICKGEDPSICQHLVSTKQLNMTTGKFLMKDEREKTNITITVREVTTEDTGTYWCGAESTDKKRSNQFFHRLVMTVVPPPATSPVSSTVPTSTSAESDGGPQVVIIVIVCVAVLLLLLLLALIFILIYKRFAHSKNTRNATAAQQIREDYVYEEIQEPDSGHAVNTVYTTANFTSNPSASLHYSAVKFQKSSDKAGGEALILRPSSSACEYSTVKNSQSPTYYTVNEPSRPSHDPLYSTINKPR